MGSKTSGSEQPSAPDPLIGQILDHRYRVIERLAEGGMGTVYRAEHIALHKEVAIKLVQDAENSDHAMRFLREAMMTSRIDHPNVISAIDYGTFEQGAYLVMSLVEGPTLSHVMKLECPMSWARAAEIGAQIADAAAAAQAQGIVHRDLKPENVVLQPIADGTEVVKVLDFGIAKYARDSLVPPQVRDAQHVTRLGVVVGTPGYMAPEQALGMRAGHRADLYSIGVMLWECVAGRRLWDCGDVQQLLTAQLSSRPPPLRLETGDPTIPEAFEALVAELLATRPEKRPQSAVETRDRLRSLLEAERRGSQPGVELPPIAQPGPIVAVPPPDTDTVFIDAALAGWRAGASEAPLEAEPSVGASEEQPTTRVLTDTDTVFIDAAIAGWRAGASEAPREAEPSVGASEEQPTTRVLTDTDTVFIDAAIAGWRAGASEAPREAEPLGGASEEPSSCVLPPLAATVAVDQPTTRVGFRVAARMTPSDVALEAGASSPPREEPATDREEPATDIASTVAPKIAGEPTDGVAVKPHLLFRLYVVVPLALAVLSAMLWAAYAFESSTAVLAGSVGAHDTPRAERGVVSGLDATRAAPESPLVNDPTATATHPLPAHSSAQPTSTRTIAQTAPASRSPASMKQDRLAVVARASSERELAKALRARARAHFRRAEFDLAAQTYRLAIDAAPGYAGAYAGLGASQLALGDARGAISSYKDAIRRSPGTSGFHAALGRAYVMTHDRARGLAEYRKAVALNPANEVAEKALERLAP
jgi:serine/threonine-protein kinase